MFNIVALFFIGAFQSEYEPIHLILGTSMGILLIVIVIKKITMRIKMKEKEDSKK
jgi:hypothetical protein